MYKTLSFALLAIAVAAGSVAAAPGTRATAAPAANARPAMTLKQATGQTNFSEAYCSRLLQRCENGESNACTLYNQGCTD
jgi:hypothetical protein